MYEPQLLKAWRLRREQDRRSLQSYEKWCLLPDDFEEALEQYSGSKLQFKAMNAKECATSRLGLTRKQRSTHLERAAERGDLHRVEALLSAGVDIKAVNEYGQTALFLAAWAGHAEVVELLLGWGADSRQQSNGGVPPRRAAEIRGNQSVLGLLPVHCQALPLTRCTASSLTGKGVLTSVALPPVLSSDAGMAFYIDDAFSEDFLSQLEALWRSLPVAPRGEVEGVKIRPGNIATGVRRELDRSRQDTAPRRSYFCDVEGQIAEVVMSAVRKHTTADSKAPRIKAFAHMRFLHYADVGGFLAAHTDLSRTDNTGQKSTHTFLLYLAGAQLSNEGSRNVGGGETVLLERVHQAAQVVQAVAPIRGRLLVYPHLYPHRAQAVELPPKLLLRGEMV
eukprot:TRINITY_DN107740_c0_g1_i1.p1 TRINITY_DN107740_c0_g1~~TRINITY_DN107740_c0_g1_i1.p1  ORF type:complete len:428 (+),score=66.94 TRINITY_DN107740_c0_g1_i1:106-1284(+)